MEPVESQIIEIQILFDRLPSRAGSAIVDGCNAANGGIHPNCGEADTRLLHRARLTAVPATRGAGLHPNREVWVRQPREATRSGFVPKNKHRPEANKTF